MGLGSILGLSVPSLGPYASSNHWKSGSTVQNIHENGKKQKKAKGFAGTFNFQSFTKFAISAVRMNQLLRKSSSHSARNFIVSVGALGSGLLYANRDSDPRTRITVSINKLFHESLSLLPWKLSGNLRPHPLFLSAEQGQFGNLPLFSSRDSSAPSEDIKKGAHDGEGDAAKPFVGRRVIRPWLGLKMVDLDELIIAQLKERDVAFPNVSGGVLIPMVAPDSPADRAGFHLGDIVIEFDGKPIKSIKEIVEILEDRIGVPLKVVVIRANDNVVTLTVVPEEVSNLM